MRTETEIKVDGMKVLINALGSVGAEQFVSAVMREGLDYTAWRSAGLPSATLDATHQAAMNYPAPKAT
jgi:hypothetical protein